MKAQVSWKIFPYILLVAYVLFVTYGFYNFNYRLNFLINHPVHVLQYARDIKTRLGEMQISLPSLMTRPELTYDDITKILETQEAMQNASFLAIKKIFKGKPELLTQLEDAFKDIRSVRRSAAKQLLGNNSYEKSIDLYTNIVEPKVHAVDKAISAIINSAQNILETQRKATEKDVIINLLITIVFGLIIALSFFIVNRQDKAKTRMLEDRERLFNQLSQNVDEIFIIATNAHVFNYVTTNSKRIINLDASAILANTDLFFEFLPIDDAKWLRQILGSPSAKDSSNEHDVIMESGNRVFKLCVYPTITGNNTIISLQDRTNEFRSQQALSDALENAHAASVAKSSFLSHMSHEIRTPMNAIIGMTTIALTRINDIARVEDCLGKIAESSRHLLRLINDVLDMSKIENGKLSITHEPFSLPDNIRNINDLVRPQAEAKNIDFEIYQENVEEDELTGDPLRLNQILINILSNALKFTPPGGMITLKIRQLSKKRNNLRMAFVITDTGIGMSQEFMDRLYKPFEQATATTTAKYGGTGLGMSITFNLVMLMGGTINVESKEGHGTTFTVELPFGYNEKSGEHAATLPRLKVLVVDDDHGTCEHATLLLERMGLSVRWCTSGQEAVELVREAHEAAAGFDVCFIDWKMPGMDGAETARRIREVAHDDLLIIIISAYDWSPIEATARKAGVNDFVAKPFFASTLHNVLLSATQRISMAGGGDVGVPDRFDFSGKRILLVEDNEFNREIAQEFLDMVNATVETAENGQLAVDKFRASEPGYYDLILMDVQMPVMDGYEATRTIRRCGHPDATKVHILAMTANAFSEDVANAISAGMNGHIAKPIDVKDLYRLLKIHLAPGAKA